jgi:hypothetical protein
MFRVFVLSCFRDSLSKLLQEAQVIPRDEANVVDAVEQHGDALGAHSEGEIRKHEKSFMFRVFVLSCFRDSPSKLLQEAQVIPREEADVVDAVK